MKIIQKALVVVVALAMMTPFFGATASLAAKPHKVVLRNLTVDTFIPGTKTITAHDGSNTSYTINASKAKLKRASGEKAKVSGFFEIYHNDSIIVWGKTTDGTNINGSKIKNNSTRKVKGKYLATIFSMFPAGIPFPPGVIGGFSATRSGDPMLTVFTYGNTKYKFGKHKTTFAALQIGDVVDIQGIFRNLGSFAFFYNTTKIIVKSHGTTPTLP
jgi:hypothetical protein